MTLVLIASQPNGTIQNSAGDAKPGPATFLDSNRNPATHYADAAGTGASTAAITADSRGRIMRWIPAGTYTQVISGEELEFHATPGSVESRVGTPTTTDYTPTYRSGVGLTVWVPPTGINPHSSEYGAVGDGIANDLTALLAASARANVLKSHVDLFGDYLITSGQFGLSDGVVLKGRGPGLTRILQGMWSNTLIRVAGTLGTAVALTADATVPNGITLTMGSTVGFAVGDTLLLGSDAPAYGSVASTNGKRGEYVRVRAVTSGTVLTLWGPVRDNYLVADAAQIQKATLKKGLGVQDLAIVNTEPGAHITSMLDFTATLNPFVSNVAFEGCDSTAVIFDNCFGGDAEGCKFTDQPDQVGGSPARFGYGIAATNATEGLTVRGIVGRRLRHLFTTVTTGNVRGIPRNITVQGIARDMLGPAFDTHPAAEDIVFNGCEVSGCTHAGYQIRGINNRLLGSAASWCADGVWVAGAAHGAEIRGSSFKHLGGFQTNAGEDSAGSADQGGYGVYVVASVDGMAEGVTIDGNTFAHMLRAGVTVLSTSSHAVKRLAVVRNRIINPGQVGSSQYGVQFQGTVSDIIDSYVEGNEMRAYASSGSERRTSGAISDGVRVDSAAVTSLRVLDNDVDGASGQIVGGARAADANIRQWHNRKDGTPVDKDNGQPGIYAPSSLGWLPALAAPTPSRAQFARFVPLRDMVVTSLAFVVSTLGADVACDVGIYDSALNRLGVSTAATGRLNSAGVKNIALGSSVTLRAGKTYYAAFSCDAGNTAVCVLASYANASLPSIFGSAAGTVEVDFKAASHPLPTTLTVTGSTSSAVLLAVREA